MDKERNRVGMVYQINPDMDELYGGQFIVATEIKDWGIQGYLLLDKPYEGLVRLVKTGQAFIRCKWEKIAPIGDAEWFIDDRDQ